MHHYNSVVLLQIIICNDDDGEHIYGATLQSCSGACMGVANNYTCYHQLYRLVFTPVQQSCPHTFYTCLTLYLFNFGGKIYMSSMYRDGCAQCSNVVLHTSSLFVYILYQPVYQLKIILIRS